MPIIKSGKESTSTCFRYGTKEGYVLNDDYFFNQSQFLKFKSTQSSITNSLTGLSYKLMFQLRCHTFDEIKKLLVEENFCNMCLDYCACDSTGTYVYFIIDERKPKLKAYFVINEMKTIVIYDLKEL